MLYDHPVHRPLGDVYMTVEFGDELSLVHNFRVIGLQLNIEKAPIEGVREAIPTHRSLGLVYDPFVISFDELVRELQAREHGLEELTVVPSRVLRIPIWYNDPWSHECAVSQGAPNNIEFLAEINGITVEEVVATHSSTDHWVSAVGFQPGTYQALPLEPAKALTAPKYERPRRWTPDRLLCIAGQITSFYPVESPGGYQLLGRTPLDLYDPDQRNAAFAEGPVLTRVSDRHRYVTINEETYWAIRREVEAGSYAYEIDDGVYELARYQERVNA